MDLDVFYMKKAINLAKKGAGYASPNPLVGAIIVLNKKIIGKGCHKVAGGSHAEIVAINNAIKNGYSKKDFKKSVLYVNLEPCCHFGKTGPCCEEIVKNGFKKVVISHTDPSEKVNGKGISFLKKHGIDVKLGVCEYEAKIMNQFFIKTALIKTPYVTLKAGITMDGRISAGKGVQEWITNDSSRKDGYLLRSLHDAIVVGANTVIVDDPQLTTIKNRRLFRVILDGRLRTDVSSRVYRDQNVLVAYTSLAHPKNIEKFKKSKIKIEKFGNTSIDIKKLLKYLYKKFDITSVFVEGGGEVNGSFVDSKQVDRVFFYVAPEILGGKDSISVVEGEGAGTIKNALKIKNLKTKKINSDILLYGNVNEYL